MPLIENTNHREMMECRPSLFANDTYIRQMYILQRTSSFFGCCSWSSVCTAHWRIVVLVTNSLSRVLEIKQHFPTLKTRDKVNRKVCLT